MLVIRFAWLGVMEKLGVWANEPNLDASLSVDLMGTCDQDRAGRVLIHAPFLDLLFVLFPSGYTVDGQPSSLPRSAVPGA